jgi:hypothetical protein
MKVLTTRRSRPDYPVFPVHPVRSCLLRSQEELDRDEKTMDPRLRGDDGHSYRGPLLERQARETFR